MAIRTGPLGYGFTAIRLVQILCLSVVIAMAGRLASNINKVNAPAQPPAVSWSIAVCTVLMVWCLGTLYFHLAGQVIRYLITTIVDAVFIPLTIVVSVYLGRPLPQLSCAAVRAENHGISGLAEVYKNLPGDNQSYPDGRLYPSGEKPFPELPWAGGLPTLNGLGTGTHPEDLNRVREETGRYAQWVGRVASYCVTMKVAWAVSIVFVLLMIMSAVMAYLIYRKTQGIPDFVDPDDFENAGVGSDGKKHKYKGRSKSHNDPEMRGAGILSAIGVGPGTQTPSAPPTANSHQHSRNGSTGADSYAASGTHEVYGRSIVGGTSSANSSEEALRISEDEERRERERRRKSSGDVLIPPPPHLPSSMSSTTSSTVSPLSRPVNKPSTPSRATNAPSEPSPHSRNVSNASSSQVHAQSQPQHQPPPQPQNQTQIPPQTQQTHLPYPLFPEDYNRHNNHNQQTPTPRQPSYKHYEQTGYTSPEPKPISTLTIAASTTINPISQSQSLSLSQSQSQSQNSHSQNSHSQTSRAQNSHSHSQTRSTTSRTLSTTTVRSTSTTTSTSTSTTTNTNIRSLTSSPSTPLGTATIHTAIKVPLGKVTLPPKADYYPYTYTSDSSTPATSEVSSPVLRPLIKPTSTSNNTTNTSINTNPFRGGSGGYGYSSDGNGGNGGGGGGGV